MIIIFICFCYNVTKEADLKNIIVVTTFKNKIRCLQTANKIIENKINLIDK